MKILLKNESDESHQQYTRLTVDRRTRNKVIRLYECAYFYLLKKNKECAYLNKTNVTSMLSETLVGMSIISGKA